MYYNTESPVIKKGYLVPYPGEQKSNYYEIFKEKVFEDTNDGENITETIVVGSTDLIKRNFVDYANANLHSIETSAFTDSIFLVKEELPKFDWNIKYKDTLKIGNYTCKKATVDFRGRTYIAWYSTEIPLPYGPWKFNGLPGLIFEIYDTSRRYEWSLSAISNKTINEDDLNAQKANKTITLRDYIEERERRFKRKQKQLSQNIRTRSDRGIVVREIEVTNNRSGKELVFEWEEQNVQD